MVIGLPASSSGKHGRCNDLQKHVGPLTVKPGLSTVTGGTFDRKTWDFRP